VEDVDGALAALGAGAERFRKVSAVDGREELLTEPVGV
jgi:hypothetical protein